MAPWTNPVGPRTSGSTSRPARGRCKARGLAQVRVLRPAQPARPRLRESLLLRCCSSNNSNSNNNNKLRGLLIKHPHKHHKFRCRGLLD